MIVRCSRACPASLQLVCIVCVARRAGGCAYADFEIALKLGGEVDSNPRRQEVGSPADYATRFLTTFRGNGPLADDLVLDATGRIGGRTLIDTTDENAVLAQADLGLYWLLSEAWRTSATSSWKDRNERGGFRDYTRTESQPGAAMGRRRLERAALRRVRDLCVQAQPGAELDRSSRHPDVGLSYGERLVARARRLDSASRRRRVAHRRRRRRQRAGRRRRGSSRSSHQRGADRQLWQRRRLR